MRRSMVIAVAAAIVAATPAARAGDFQIAPGSSTGDDFGASIGLDLRDGVLRAAWSDNSAELAGNPDRPALDIAFSASSALVNVTALPLSQVSPSLAVDPLDPANLVVSALDADPGGTRPSALVALSRDGGATWKVARGFPSNLGGFPPRVAFDSFGNCFLALVHDPDFGSPRVELFVSTDGGGTFAPVQLPARTGVETNVALAAGFGAVWLAFHAQGGPGFVVKTLAAPVSGRGSVGAFAFATVSGTDDGRVPDIALGPGGRVVVAYGKGAFGEAPGVAAQLDPDGLGPAPFGEPVTVANVPGYPFLPRPRVAFDGARAYLVYQDRDGAAASENVFLNFSDDGGAWSAATRVNDPVFSRDRLLPNVAVAPGAVAAAWYDFRSGEAVLRGRVLVGVTRPAEPAGPVDLFATAVARDRIDLRWTNRSDNETGFLVRRLRTVSLFEPPHVTAFALPPGATSFSDTGLEEDTGYAYEVVAVNDSGESTPSNTATATTLDSPPPAPQNLTATAVTFQRIDLAWAPSEDADFYEVQQSTDGVTFTTISRPIVTQMMIFGLQPATTYFFRVRAVNSGGPSPFSNVASATTANVEPAAPGGLTARAVSSSRIDLAWRDDSSNETRFEVERGTNGTSFKRIATLAAGTTSFSDTGLRAGRTFFYRVRACNTVGCSLYSNVASATTPRT